MALTQPQQLFVNALRSGEYRQGRGKLRSDGTSTGGVDRFCCLGVATDLFIKETGKGAWIPDGISGYGFRPADVERPTTAGFLPKEVAVWLDLPEQPSVSQEVHFSNGELATQLNDVTCLNFAKLADRFEAYFEEVNSTTKEINDVFA